MPEVAVAVTGLVGLLKVSRRSVVPCVAWKVWNKWDELVWFGRR